jgi:hypothetical protein
MKPQIDLTPYGLTVDSLLEILSRELDVESCDLLLACGSIARGWAMTVLTWTFAWSGRALPRASPTRSS